MSQELELLDKALRLCATGLVSVLATSALGYVRSMSQSIKALELSVAQLLARGVLLEKALDSLSVRLKDLENRNANPEKGENFYERS